VHELSIFLADKEIEGDEKMLHKLIGNKESFVRCAERRNLVKRFKEKNVIKNDK
jgi:hypothetical protein